MTNETAETAERPKPTSAIAQGGGRANVGPRKSNNRHSHKTTIALAYIRIPARINAARSRVRIKFSGSMHIYVAPRHSVILPRRDRSVRAKVCQKRGLLGANIQNISARIAGQPRQSLCRVSGFPPVLINCEIFSPKTKIVTNAPPSGGN